MTWAPTPEQVAAALAAADARQPAESCGVIGNGAFIPIANKSTDHDAFVMDMRAFLALKNGGVNIEAIVHSHVYLPPIPSPGDMAMCEVTGLPWLIVSYPSGDWKVIEPCGYRAPLVGRKWAWGTHDCFGLVRDGLHDLAGVDIPDFDREWMWWERGGDIIATQFEQAGFVPVDDRWRHCDAIGMKIRSKVVNHVGLFLAPDVMLHQMMGRNSVRDVYGGVYQSATVLHLRHRELMR